MGNNDSRMQAIRDKRNFKMSEPERKPRTYKMSSNTTERKIEYDIKEYYGLKHGGLKSPREDYYGLKQRSRSSREDYYSRRSRSSRDYYRRSLSPREEYSGSKYRRSRSPGEASIRYSRNQNVFPRKTRVFHCKCCDIEILHKKNWKIHCLRRRHMQNYKEKVKDKTVLKESSGDEFNDFVPVNGIPYVSEFRASHWRSVFSCLLCGTNNMSNPYNLIDHILSEKHEVAFLRAQKDKKQIHPRRSANTVTGNFREECKLPNMKKYKKRIVNDGTSSEDKSSSSTLEDDSIQKVEREKSAIEDKSCTCSPKILDFLCSILSNQKCKDFVDESEVEEISQPGMSSPRTSIELEACSSNAKVSPEVISISSNEIEIVKEINFFKHPFELQNIWDKLPILSQLAKFHPIPGLTLINDVEIDQY